MSSSPSLSWSHLSISEGHQVMPGGEVKGETVDGKNGTCKRKDLPRTVDSSCGDGERPSVGRSSLNFESSVRFGKRRHVCGRCSALTGAVSHEVAPLLPSAWRLLLSHSRPNVAAGRGIHPLTHSPTRPLQRSRPPFAPPFPPSRHTFTYFHPPSAHKWCFEGLGRVDNEHERGTKEARHFVDPCAHRVVLFRQSRQVHAAQAQARARASTCTTRTDALSRRGGLHNLHTWRAMCRSRRLGPSRCDGGRRQLAYGVQRVAATSFV